MFYFRIYIGILFFLFGITVGSFLNVLIYRIPKKEDFVKTRSHCMSCGHKLRWYENIPLLSFLLQGGKCRSCGVKLSAQYPLVEGLCGLMWVACVLLFWPDWATMALTALLFPLLCAVAVIDWRTFEIPNGLAAGGASGLATIVAELCKRNGLPVLPIGMQVLALNALLMVAVVREGACVTPPAQSSAW